MTAERSFGAHRGSKIDVRVDEIYHLACRASPVPYQRPGSVDPNVRDRHAPRAGARAALRGRFFILVDERGHVDVRDGLAETIAYFRGRLERRPPAIGTHGVFGGVWS